MPQAKKKAKTDSKPAAAKKPGPALSALEAALQPEKVYNVEKLLASRLAGGKKEYKVRWEGYGEKHDSWEPMENLVGCAQQIREYEQKRDKEDKEAAAAALAKRQQMRDAAAAEEAALKARAAEMALDGAGANADDANAVGVMKTHARKKGAVWSAFDLTVEKPCCLLAKEGGFGNSASKLYALLDKDGDGQLTEEELKQVSQPQRLLATALAAWLQARSAHQLGSSLAFCGADASRWRWRREIQGIKLTGEQRRYHRPLHSARRSHV